MGIGSSHLIIHCGCDDHNYAGVAIDSIYVDEIKNAIWRLGWDGLDRLVSVVVAICHDGMASTLVENSGGSCFVVVCVSSDGSGAYDAYAATMTCDSGWTSLLLR